MRLVNATDIRRQDLIQCDPGDYEIRVTEVQFSDSTKMVVILGQSEVGGVRRELLQAADVRLVEPSPHRQEIEKSGLPAMPTGPGFENVQEFKERYLPGGMEGTLPLWGIIGLVDEGDSFSGPYEVEKNVSIFNMHQRLTQHLIAHTDDGDFVEHMEVARDEHDNLQAVVVWTRGCRLVAYRRRGQL